MPHIVLEHSKNLNLDPIADSLFEKIPEILVETLPTKIEYCKSRIYSADKYRIGDASGNKAFLHITIKILKGRDAQVIEKASSLIIEYTSNALKNINYDGMIELSLEISDLSPFFIKQTLDYV